ncbi:hypothetical protein MK852_23810 [Shewanella benthica]|uniref:hypothetical protein n=1 Tax=Shewanella benthica TaxID=43661 RepID=UPI001879110D|nr:hypothetical protein [Shewanella benthica]MBE7216377.1 hypothetical protein [Shewanella benthica]MCL1065121.1 hypothetical protein [Shewanella benthica]
MKKYLLSNRDNREFFQHYDVKHVAYDFTMGESKNIKFDDVCSGDQVTVLKYGTSNSVIALTYIVDRIELNHISKLDGCVTRPNGLVIGKLVEKSQSTKKEAAEAFSELFNVNGDFKRGVNIKAL